MIGRPKSLGEDLSHVLTRERPRPSRPVRLPGVASRADRDLDDDGRDVPYIDVTGPTVAEVSAGCSVVAIMDTRSNRSSAFVLAPMQRRQPS